MLRIHTAWYEHRWEDFAKLFCEEYEQAKCDEHRLALLRRLLCEWKDTRALSAVVKLHPELKALKLGTILAK